MRCKLLFGLVAADALILAGVDRWARLSSLHAGTAGLFPPLWHDSCRGGAVITGNFRGGSGKHDDVVEGVYPLSG